MLSVRTLACENTTEKAEAVGKQIIVLRSVCRFVIL